MGSFALFAAYTLYGLFLVALGCGMGWLAWHLLVDDDTPRRPARRQP